MSQPDSNKLSAAADALLDRARSSEHAVDVYLAPGATRVTADRLVELLRQANVDGLNERALWNLLFSAGELSLTVDVYRAHELFLATAALVARVAALDLPPGDPRAVAIEMAFDFFFARESHPLLPLRAREVLSTLGGLLGSGKRAAVRAAIHGLGHLVARGGDRDDRIGAEALLLLEEYEDGRLGGALDEWLRAYATEARSGTLR